MLLVDAQAFGAVAAKHEDLESRWLAYEVDPHLQFDFPAMSDTAFPATAAMIRARRKAEQAKSEGNPANYRSAVGAFGAALTGSRDRRRSAPEVGHRTEWHARRRRRFAAETSLGRFEFELVISRPPAETGVGGEGKDEQPV